MIKKFLSILSLMILSSSAFAAKFANQFVEFELPNIKWQCALEGSEWVCQSTDDQKKRDAIIVLAAKLKGDQDSLDKYENYLKEPRKFSSADGKQLLSQPKWVKTSDLNGQKWIDSLHMGSEIPDFYTRYLATIKQDIGVLVTFSINKNKYQDYLKDFDNMVTSLKVFRKAGGINTNSGQSLFNQAQLPSSFTQNQVFPTTPDEEKPKKKAKSADDDNTMLYLIGIIGVAVFIFMKKRRR